MGTVGGGVDASLGMMLHRSLYRVLASLPVGMRQKTASLWFDALFTISPDVWQYETSGYELDKRRQLMRAIPSGADVIVEFGCADGHNLMELAVANPGAQLIGLDVSHRALTLAGERLVDYENVRLICTADPIGWEYLKVICRSIDVLILSEVLYYLGTSKSIEQSLLPLRRMLNHGSDVVMLHSGDDASALHESAGRALGFQIWSEQNHRLDGRRYSIAWARTGIEPSSRNSHGA
ncbi:MAG: class I SAM-dependent methyltransferase [Actinomycetota bacterium]|nr:class I SAM-dependent methyltransferase [Actinomycetota bacterium]